MSTSSPSLTRTLRLNRPLAETNRRLADTPSTRVRLPGIDTTGSDGRGWTLKVHTADENTIDLVPVPGAEARRWAVHGNGSAEPAGALELVLAATSAGTRATLKAGPLDGGSFGLELAERASAALYQFLLNLDREPPVPGPPDDARLAPSAERPVRATSTTPDVKVGHRRRAIRFAAAGAGVAAALFALWLLTRRNRGGRR